MRDLKRLLLALLRRTGFSRLVAASPWRRRRLLVLCYHGISLDDEHRWDGGLFMEPALFKQRLEWIRAFNSTVLPLAEALDRLAKGTLPERAVAITFDDGLLGVQRFAWPLLREFGWPMTLYLTTYYCSFNRPVFDPAVAYLLWKSRLPVLDWPGVLHGLVELNQEGRASATRRIKAHALQKGYSGQRKDELLSELAERLDVDLAEIRRRRIMHLVNPEEARALSAEGVDIQLHTHVHRVFRKRERFLAEIERNRREIAAITGREASHFCYPGGAWLPEFPGWLSECGVRSATTCQNGMCTSATPALILPRLVDTSTLTKEEFDGWLGGVASWLPRRAMPMAEGQILDE